MVKEHFDKEDVELVEVVNLPTQVGDDTKFFLFKRFNEYISVLAKGEVFRQENVMCRIHSECMFGDLFDSKKCDCGEQLAKAKQLIAQEGHGLLFYLGQEGRGIGLKNKTKAYKLQEKGYDTVEANMELGFVPDLRDYEACAIILKDYFKVGSLRLLTNNLKKVKPLQEKGIHAVMTPIKIEPNKHNEKYLGTKKARMGHRL
ncbi:GTP cyclohydrolase II [Candidatus Woesearchaeota archaeon]|jgi:3,4-dihydroxy 2-butanone 4-phosphate synthase / GTP cyclohydrolase II|nr:GTP cyclohydrolase II [Candidatus Woesearchaeota archaeon]MBT5272211.1 GTP cyclohydrolase II [Candidatus Woesearchaeota archaeon]MBT6041555.1 GTP cyclohydrolase II [Candidatus Woesearchaeota archaeon]MBT6336917.1 GTP cyclohydrolase II [Candidatus Woesearchaeota archaeon]MBT7927787.1 GTP cyclohydrolase II [Candidatus Woesearchaeota archaeon]